MYLMTCTRPDLAYPLSLLARYMAPDRHRKVHWDAAKRILRYLCSTSGMGLVLGGRGPVVLIDHVDASWVDDSATQRSSQGYTFSLGSGSVSWRSTCLSSVLSSSCEAEIYAGAMAAQELHWLTYLLTDLGEQPHSPPVLYVDNKAMIALCQEHRLEHRTKHIALRYFFARELQQRGQLRLAYVATRANTADIFTKALPPGDHQRFSTVLGLLVFLILTGLVTTCSPPLCLWGDVLEDRHSELEYLAAASPTLCAMLLSPEGDHDALDIPTPRTYREAVSGPWASQWKAAIDSELASWRSTGTYVDAAPPPRANVVDGMWLFKVKRPPGSPPVFKARYVWSLRRPVYGLRQSPREWHETLRSTLCDLGFRPSSADLSLFVRASSTPFFILVYVDNLVFTTPDRAALAEVKSELQKRHTCTDLGELQRYLGLQIRWKACESGERTRD
ncbi:unnamed protein product [Closterium sp. NIES-53]